MPIYKAIATGNRTNEFYRETTRSIANNLRSSKCQTCLPESELLFPSRPLSFFVNIYLLRNSDEQYFSVTILSLTTCSTISILTLQSSEELPPVKKTQATDIIFLEEEFELSLAISSSLGLSVSRSSLSRTARVSCVSRCWKRVRITEGVRVQV